MKTLSCFLTALMSVPGIALGADPKKPAFQYKSEGIEVPAATAEEPKVKAFGPDTVKAAAKYLDDGAHDWVRTKSCLACHSTGVYMVERSALTKQLGKPSEEVLKDFIKSVPQGLGKPGDGNAATFVWRSSGLASWDRHVEGKLSEHTDRSLRHMVSTLPDDNMYNTIKLIEIPYITTRFELTVQALRAMVTAPSWLANLKDAELRARVERIKKFLREHQPINDYELALKLQLANLLPELVSKEEREAAIAMLWRKQLPDGGWSTRRMSDLLKWRLEVHPPSERQPWKEAMDPTVVALIQNLPDAANPGSDPYMTAFAIVLLRESGVPASDPRIQRGIAWLKENQRVSGRWWMHSLYRGNYNYITYISTAQALRALALCDELPTTKASDGAKERPLKVFVLAGTSNMLGAPAKIDTLPDDLRQPLKDVLVYQKGEWAPLEAGKNLVGNEATFGQAMTKHLGEPIGIVWISVASASGNSPGASINNIVKQAREKGRPIVIAGVLLDVSFRDGIKEETAKAYGENLTRWIESTRKEIGNAHLPIVMNRAIPPVPNTPYLELVRKTQDSVKLPSFRVFHCDDVPRSGDKVHFNTEGRLEMGKRFAAGIIELLKVDK